MPKLRKTIYLDYAAATPLDASVQKTMLPFLGQAFGNPSSLHHMGQQAKKAMELARQEVAGLIGARAEEIIFTSGGTESCNLAILGLAQMFKQGRVVTTALEHHAVLESCGYLQKCGYEVVYLKPNELGMVDPEQVKKAISAKTFLVTVMLANNEIGSIQNIQKISKVVSSLNIKRRAQKLPEVLLHTDACQGAGLLDINVNRLGVDLMTVSGSKIYGPKGVGFLFVRSGVNLAPVVYGGGQEKGLRSGTENVAGIVGLAKALTLVQKSRLEEFRRLSALRDYFIKQALKIKDVRLNGPSGINRSPNNVSLAIKDLEAETLMLYLDSRGICVSTGSACSTGSTELSHVIKSIKLAKEWANGVIRISLGSKTTKQQLDYTLKVLKQLIPTLRRVEQIKT